MTGVPLESAAVQAVLQHWLDARGDRPCPDKDDIDPAAFPQHLHKIWMCTVDESLQEFRYRLSGEHINRVFGFSLKGRSLTEILDPDLVPVVRYRYRRVAEDPCIHYSLGHVYADKQQMGTGERLIMPLGLDGRIGVLIGVTEYSLGYLPSNIDHQEIMHERFVPLDRADELLNARQAAV